MGDGSVAFLAGGVPDLYFYLFVVEVDCFGCEFDSDCGFGLEGELVLLEAGEKVGFADSGIWVKGRVPPITTILKRKSKPYPIMAIVIIITLF